METKGFFQFKIIINVLVSSSFEYLCQESTTFRNIVIIPVRDRLYMSEFDVYRYQRLTYKGGPRAEKVNRKCDVIFRGSFWHHT